MPASDSSKRRPLRALALVVAVGATLTDAFSVRPTGSPLVVTPVLRTPSRPDPLWLTPNNNGNNEDAASIASASQDSSTELGMAVMNNDGSSTSTFTESDRFSRVALGNAFIIGSVVAAGAYELLHVNVEALLALWQYGLGQTTGPEVTKVAVALDLFARLPVDAVRSYEQLVPTNPIFYKACTSGAAYALGDFISQIYQGKDLETIDLPRSLRSGAAGFIGHGPLCHYWLTFMETYLDFGGAWWATGIKVTADLTVWAVFLNAAYSFLIGMLAFRDPRDVWRDVKATSWPALRSAWRFWPFVHTVSFSHAVPMDLKLLWVDAMEVVWVTILSKVANEDKVAKMEMEGTAIDATETSTAEGTALAASSSEASPADAPAPLPQRVLAACWPLIAMWPVLYGGYQLEKFLGLEV